MPSLDFLVHSLIVVLIPGSGVIFAGLGLNLAFAQR